MPEAIIRVPATDIRVRKANVQIPVILISIRIRDIQATDIFAFLRQKMIPIREKNILRVAAGIQMTFVLILSQAKAVNVQAVPIPV